MEVTRAMLDEAVARGVLQKEQAPALWSFLSGREAPETPSFKPSHILYYLGGLTAIGAMTLFMTLGWEQFGGQGLLMIAVGYGLVSLLLTEFFLRRRGLLIPAGITAALAVVMVPLAVYGAQHVMGLWPASTVDGVTTYRDYHYLIDWRWIVMELATLAAGAAALWRYRLPFIMLPIAVTCWYLSMDLTPFLYGDSFEWYSEPGKWVSIAVGIGMIGVALIVDLRSRAERDFPFWLYVFGVIAFWGGLSSMNSDSELNKLIYCGINLLMIAVGAALSRRVFAIFGALGVAGYLGHLSSSVFKDSMMFPVALTAIGFAVIGAGILWQRHEEQIGEVLRSLLPAELRSRLEARG